MANKLIVSIFSIVLVLIFILGLNGLNSSNLSTASPSGSISSLSLNPLERFSIKGLDYSPKTIELTLEIGEINKIYFDGRNTSSYAFNEMIPGPVIRAKVGDTLKITAKNNLNEGTSVHWHGLQIKNSEDGVPGITQDPIAPGDSFVYELEMKNPGTYWYHPHASTHEQVEKGLYGALIVEDDLSNDIPYDKDYVLMLDDIRLDKNYQISKPWTGHMDKVSGRYGSNMIINGIPNPSFNVTKNSIVRLRLINSANARLFYFGINGKNMTVIGEDIGLVKEPYSVQYLPIAPGERYDVLVEIGSEDSLDIINYHSKGFTPIGQIQTFGDSNSNERTSSILGKTLNPTIPSFDILMGQEANFTLNLEGINDGTGIRWTINGKTFPEDPESIELDEGSAYKIKLTNNQPRVHPMHLHGQKFMILSRNGVPVKQNAWKDTVIVNNYETVEIGLIAEGKGTWVTHCHILEHAELGMLGTVVVT